MHEYDHIASDTRVAVQNEILTWARRPPDQTDSTNILCITGAAGTGKSAFMQTLAETSWDKRELAASFFFSFRSPKRNDAKHFVATIAYQLALSDKTLRGYVAAAVHKDPSVFEKDMASQMQSLVVEPLHKAIQSDPSFERTFTCRTIYVDGVDECGPTPKQTSDQPFARGDTTLRADAAQSLVLEVSINAFASLPLHSPFRIIFASRPERAMRAFLKSAAHPFHIELDEKYDPDSDIRLYLSASFERIRLKYDLPPHWVTDTALHSIVVNASGQFIYAATVIRHVDGPSETPEQALQEVLSIGPVEDNHTNPFATLNALYHSIFKKCSNPQQSALLIRVIGTPNLIPRRVVKFSGVSVVNVATSNVLLELQPSDVERIFGRLHSLISIPESDSKRYAFYHKSLRDFLSDKCRSKHLYFAQDDVFARALIGFLRVTRHAMWKSVPSTAEFTILKMNVARLFAYTNLENPTLQEELDRYPVRELLSYIPWGTTLRIYKIVHVREMGVSDGLL